MSQPIVERPFTVPSADVSRDWATISAQRIANVLLGFAFPTMIAIVWLSLFPGMLADWLFFTVLMMFFLIPVVAVAAIPFAILVVRDPGHLTGFPMGRLCLSFLMVMLGISLAIVSLPCRLAFGMARPQFEVLLETAPKPDQHVELHHRVGMFLVDEVASDPRGGVYFRTYRGADGLGPDTMSYGFVHRPNREGTPFGAAHYGIGRLTGDWFWFMASNDWH